MTHFVVGVVSLAVGFFLGLWAGFAATAGAIKAGKLDDTIDQLRRNRRNR